jgi:hypothetical protein
MKATGSLSSQDFLSVPTLLYKFVLPGAVETERILGFAEGLANIADMAGTGDVLGLDVIAHTLPKWTRAQNRTYVHLFSKQHQCYTFFKIQTFIPQLIPALNR